MKHLERIPSPAARARGDGRSRCGAIARQAAWLFLFSLGTLLGLARAAAQTAAGSEGVVKFFVDAKSDFDPWTSSPTSAQQTWMRENYYRMQTYSPWFDSRLSWYPWAWDYKDSYAIKSSWAVFTQHPEWVLRDANGQMLYIPYACSGGTCTQYAADVGNQDFRNWWIDGAKSKIALGYDGIWVDDVNLEWRIGDGNGTSVKPIDPRTGSEMTLANWRRYFAEFLEQLRAAVPTAELAHNVIWAAQPVDDPYVLRAYDAANYINFERGITDAGIVAGTSKYGFETFLALVDRVHARGRNVIMDDDDDTSIIARDYELAFYFLINNGGDLLGADGDRSRMNPTSFWAGYETDLGAALGARYKWNGLFRRDFECGMVLVNQPGQPLVTASLAGTFTNLAGLLVTQVALVASSGQVLKNATCTREPTPNPPTDLRVTD
jgi:hypothetical protein